MNIGEKLRQLRLFRNLTQEEMADRCELSKGFISQVERDLASPSIATLTDMLECLGSSLQEFFSEAKDNKIVFSPDDMFEKADGDTLMNKITWLVPSAQKNNMEPILLELQEGGRSAVIPSHEGEEFGYVLSGSIVLVIGSSQYRVRAGESFCIHPRSEHFIQNNSKRVSKLLWVSNPPNF
ncbi:MAG: Cro/Cl family transcriptional regulator [Clostridiales bacterium]|nr:Cro/Cl family transcriptional regulator [Clostridiales bacterium]